MKQESFWDSSAILPLLISESTTAQAIANYQVYAAVIWWGALVEIESALARLVRIRIIDRDQLVQAKIAGDLFLREAKEIEPSDLLRSVAAELVYRHELRAGDALQLAAALRWVGNDASGQRFFSHDRRLIAAAQLTGFQTEDLSPSDQPANQY